MSSYNLFSDLRVRISALSAQDAETMARWSEDAEFSRSLDTDYIVPHSAEYFRSQIQSIESDEDRLEFGIRTLEENLLIGFVSLHSIEWNNRAASLAVGIGENSYRSKGYGTEAIKLILRYAFNELNLNRVGLDVISSNEAAIHSYEKCGFITEGVVRKGVIRDGQVLDRIYMGILYEEWKKTTL